MFIYFFSDEYVQQGTVKDNIAKFSTKHVNFQVTKWCCRFQHTCHTQSAEYQTFDKISSVQGEVSFVLQAAEISVKGPWRGIP